VKNIIALMAAILLTACFCGAAGGPAKIPIILDTDIGTDIDDAFALALIINSPEFDLLGVTTVSGDTQARARIAAKMLWEAGGKWRRVPVVAGVPGAKQDINQAPWADGFTSPQMRNQSAVSLLRELIERRPGNVTLIAIGELTNVAALIKADPLTAKKIHRIALMGGSIARGYETNSPPDAEWNIKSNPKAAQVVFTSGIPIIMAPLDVTAMLKLDARARERIFHQNTPATNSLAALYRLWKGETPTLFDPMAVALVLDPTLCHKQNLAIAIDDKGFTRVAPGHPVNAAVGLSTNASRFMQYYIDKVTNNR
jgi:purine nucleosidase